MTYKDDMHTHFTAILIVFLSDADLMEIEHMHLGVIVRHVGSCLTRPDDINSFLESIENDPAAVRKRHSHGKDVGSARSYFLLVANYRDVMAFPTDPPYCLVYPTVYD